MKRVLTITILLMIIGMAGRAEACYTMIGAVKEASPYGALIEDSTGDVWYYEQEGFKVNEKVKMFMYDRHTTTKEDDVILRVKKVK